MAKAWDDFTRRYRLHEMLHRDRLARLAADSIDLMRRFHRERGDMLMLSFSGGKDSVLMIELARLAGIPHVPVWMAYPVFPGTMAMMRHYGVRLVHHRHWYEMWEAQYGCQPAWSARPAMDAVIDHDRELDALWGIRGTLVGMRRDESVKRRYALQEEIIKAKSYAGGWRCAPLAAWRTDDVWAYTLGNGLPVNAQYPALVEWGADPQMLRVASIASIFLNDLPADQSKQAMRSLYPAAINAFLADNPYVTF
ncbi:phosphoadenosine phosphosulfate reductase family protein [bacterium]|nr:phosphoadenosine phosphosulfate reductase family protein [bacterium]